MTHPNLHTEWRMVTPDQAAALLESNACNRNISPRDVNKYARAMAKGQWVDVGDPIRISTDGRLLDGQHRLTALVLAGIPVRLLVITGVPAAHQDRMDGGRKRSAADQLRMMGMKDSNVASSVANMVMAWQVDDIPARRISYSTHDIVGFVEDNLDTVERAVTWGRRTATAIHASSTQAGAAYFMAESAAGIMAASSFYDALVSGHNLSPGDPILTVRGVFLRHKTDQRRGVKPNIEAYWLAKAWNHWRNGNTVGKILLPKGGELIANDYRMR